eukprot:TRINITY_DN5223_c0_g1_i2.p1 TRINITY_DN5223_c0_g1~~TRINITY_DN5223_c0_g1_i2.p1  ORF type:complete len:431 (-),score=182.45 TRINITY_DN5223_c0_g1_i2:386-1678(-)
MMQSQSSSYDPQQYGAAGGVPFSDASARTLWMGDIDNWMDENYVMGLFLHTGQVPQVKIIRDRTTGLNAGYCFIEFYDSLTAKMALESLNGKPLPDRNGKVFRLNWASHSTLSGSAKTDGNEYSLFVGDLAQEVNDFMLLKLFADRYPSVRGARVIIDPLTGNSRRYGFVRFGDEDELNRSISEMQGHYCCNRPMRLNKAATKKTNEPQPLGYASAIANTSEDPSNTTIFVGGVDANIGEPELRGIFQSYGEITLVKLVQGKNWAFITFTTHQSAERAIAEMNTAIIGNSRVRVSWGKGTKTGNSAPQAYPMGGSPYQYPQYYAQPPPNFYPPPPPVPGYSPYGYGGPPPPPGSAPAPYGYGAPAPGALPPGSLQHGSSMLPSHPSPFKVDDANQQYLKRWNRNLVQSFDPASMINTAHPSTRTPYMPHI